MNEKAIVSLKRPSAVKLAQGIGLVELMVAMTLGLIVVAAVGYIYVASLQSYRTQDALSRLQENGRFAFEILSRDVRMAGSDACGAGTKANVVIGSDWYLNLNGGLFGYESGSGLPAAVTGELAGRDAISIIHADNDSSYTITDHHPESAQFDLSGPSDLQKGELLVACAFDGTHSAVLQMSGPDSASPSNVVHNTGVAGISPGNCTKYLGSTPSPCNGSTHPLAGTSYEFDNGRLMRLSSVTYFIRNNPAGVPSLYRQKLGATGGAVTTAPEELVEGVENMQITYGVDTSPADDTLDKGLKVDQYYTADNIPDLDSSGQADWERVVSVRVSLLMMTVENGVANASQTYTYNGTTVTAADRRIRKIVTNVIRVRNR